MSSLIKKKFSTAKDENKGKKDVKQSEESKLEGKGVCSSKKPEKMKDTKDEKRVSSSKKEDSLKKKESESQEELGEPPKKEKHLNPDAKSVEVKPKKPIPPREEDKGEVVGLQQERMRGAKTPFNSVLFQGQTYRVNQFVSIKDKSTQTLAKIKEIISKNGDSLHPNWPMLKVKWFYKKSQIDPIPKITKQEFEFLRDQEVFNTKMVSKVYVDQIEEKCRVFTLDEYETRKEPREDDYFYRAAYDIRSREIDPPLAAWPRSCKCKMPSNPNELYVGCDNCLGWFHPHCVGISKEEAISRETYFCPDCEAQKGSSSENTTQMVDVKN